MIPHPSTLVATAIVLLGLLLFLDWLDSVPMLDDDDDLMY